MESVFDALLLFLHLGLGRGTNVDDGDAAGELGEALLELLLVIVAGGFVDLAADLLHAALDIGALAGAFDDGGVLLINDDALGAAEVGNGDVLELDAEILGEETTAGEDGDILKDGLAAITEARGLDGAHIEGAADLVNDERGKGLALDLFGDDEEGLTGLGGGLKDGQELLEVADLLLVNENVGILEDGFLALLIGGEVGGEIALVELHALDDVEGGFDGLVLFDGDGAILANLVHGLGDDVADGGVPVGGDGGDLADFLGVIHLLGNAHELGDGGLDGLVDTALEVDRVGTGGDVLEALFVDGLSEHGGGGGAVAGSVVGLGSDFLHQLGADVLVRVCEFDFLGDGDAVLGDGGRAEFLVNDDVAALGP